MFFFFRVVIKKKIKKIKKKIQFIKENDFDDILVSIASPYPGTELWDIAMKEGYMEHNPNSASYEVKPKYSTISTKEFTAKQVEELRNKAYIEFQLSKLKRHPVKFLTSQRNYITLGRYFRFFLHDRILDPLTNKKRFVKKTVVTN